MSAEALQILHAGRRADLPFICLSLEQHFRNNELTCIQWHECFDFAAVTSIWLDGMSLQIDMPDLQTKSWIKATQDVALLAISLWNAERTCLSAADVIICSLALFGINFAAYILDV